MQYEEFAARHEIEMAKERQRLQKEADKAFNQGLWDALPFWSKWKYYYLARPI